MKRSRILCPTDFSDASVSAVATAIELAEEGGSVEVVHVFQVPPYSTPAISEHLREQAQRELHEVAARYAAARVSVSVRLLDGQVAETLTEHAAKSHADCIVLPTHGRRGLARALLGSVTERVVRLAACPVVTLPL